MSKINGAERRTRKNAVASAPEVVPQDRRSNIKDDHAEQAIDVTLKSAAVAVLGAIWKNKTLRKKVIKSVTRRKLIKRGGKTVVHALLDLKVLRKKQLKKIAGKKLAKKLVA